MKTKSSVWSIYSISRSTVKLDLMKKEISFVINNFIKSGNPNGEGLPSWTAYNTEEDNIFIFYRSGHTHMY
ncbi:hypothetical protein DI392_15075 [Vibrio albus]|uniref:Uncharacterized protein n=1 Tax=Vibrio albus TaxID=2200953 RepID=A0A2U3B6M8_9VIBR|nr:hypothetical protein DI392_15075 [Vibrio albus]